MSDLPHDLAALFDEIPRLQRARAFIASLEHIPFFGRLGEPLDEGDRVAARAYLDGLGFPHAEVAPLADWQEAADAALSLDQDPEGWEAEEMLRAGLADAALSRLEPAALDAAVQAVGEAVAQAAQEGAAHAAALWDMRDDALQTAAAGAAARAAHSSLLAVMARDDEDDEAEHHPLSALFTLFARGRWPVGLAGLTFNLF